MHNAHLALARIALVELQLDELRWVPVGEPWQKSRRITSAQHREAMVRLAIEGEPRFTLSRIETLRSGVARSFRPLPRQRTCAPQPSTMS